MALPPKSFTAKYNGRVRALITPVFISPAFDPETVDPFPEHKQYNCIWDTGATNTVITRKVIDDLSLKPIGMTIVQHAQGEATSEIFLVNIGLLNQVGISQVKVTEGILSGADVLIGMDIITTGDFAVTHKDGKTTFSFRCPCAGHIDFVEEAKSKTQTSSGHKTGRNNPCPCGSGKKFKKCCGR